MPRLSRSSSRKRSDSTDSVGIRINPHVTLRSRSSLASQAPESPVTPQSTGETSLTESSPLIPNEKGSNCFGERLKSYCGSLEKSDLGLDLGDQLQDDVFSEPWTRNDVIKQVKVAVLLILTIICTVFVVINPETESVWHLFHIGPKDHSELRFQKASLRTPVVKMSVQGPFLTQKELADTGTKGLDILQISLLNNTWMLFVNTSTYDDELPVTSTHLFQCAPGSEDNCSVEISSNSSARLSFSYCYQMLTSDDDNSIVYAIIVLVFVYTLIILELVHRTLAALLGSLAAIAVLSALNQRPTLETIVSWIDMETLSLLFGMMILVAIFSETGFFDYSALKAYQIARGKIWPLITLLCIFSAVVSAFLDNVTTILLLAPVTIRLCEVLNLDPKQLLMAEVLFSNIGGTATAIGDPPNVIIVGATHLQGITFSVFTGHATVGILFIAIGGYGFLRFHYRNIEKLKNRESPEVMELRREIELWKKTAMRVVVATREESVVKALIQQKTVELEHTLNRALHKRMRKEEKDFLSTYLELKKKYRITDFPLLIKSGFVLFVVILVLFLQSFIDGLYVGLGWVAVLGAIWLLILADISDMETILHKVEWSTLLFFAALFTLMKALAELGLITGIGDVISELVKSVDDENRLLSALVIIIWVSAITSSFIDNIPYTTAMVPVIVNLSENEELNLDLLPLVFALAFGACLGGNGTLIGASANVVCAGIAEQHGYTISFREFFLVGFPMMLITVILATGYLFIAHVFIGWNT